MSVATHSTITHNINTAIIRFPMSIDTHSTITHNNSVDLHPLRFFVLFSVFYTYYT